jgi:hypothetical protein
MKTMEPLIDETLNSLDGIGRATAPPGLYPELQARLAGSGRKQVEFKRRTYWSVAAGLALLIALNFFAAFSGYQLQGPSASSSTAEAADYFSYLESINY